jgi:hypothetical protein
MTEVELAMIDQMEAKMQAYEKEWATVSAEVLPGYEASVDDFLESGLDSAVIETSQEAVDALWVLPEREISPTELVSWIAKIYERQITVEVAADEHRRRIVDAYTVKAGTIASIKLKLDTIRSDVRRAGMAVSPRAAFLEFATSLGKARDEEKATQKQEEEKK